MSILYHQTLSLYHNISKNELTLYSTNMWFRLFKIVTIWLFQIESFFSSQLFSISLLVDRDIFFLYITFPSCLILSCCFLSRDSCLQCFSGRQAQQLYIILINIRVLDNNFSCSYYRVYVLQFYFKGWTRAVGEC